MSVAPLLWLKVFEARAPADVDSVDFILAVFSLIASMAALVFVRRIGLFQVELGWMVFVAGIVMTVLDTVTHEPPAVGLLVDAVEGGLHMTGLLGVVWGFYRYQQLRRSELGSLRTTNDRYEALVNSVDGVVWEADPETLRFLFVSRRAEALLGYRAERWTDDSELWKSRLHEEDRDWVIRYRLRHAQRREAHQLEYRLKAEDGRTLWVQDSASVIFERSGAVRLRGLLMDITARKLLERQLHHNATHDSLTGLPNRAAFVDRLEQRRRRTGGGDESAYAVVFLDLDRFKLVNDSLGHLAGDALLVEVAARLKQNLRATDLVARLGGDEFAVLLERVESEAAAVGLGRRLLTALNQPVNVRSSPVTPSASLGIVMGGPGRSDPTKLLRDADTAMYRAKEGGKGSLEVFDAGMRRRVVRRLQLEVELQAAIEQNEFEMHLQPIVDLSSGEIHSFEALLRWRRENREILLPNEFLACAEDSGLMRVIAWWALREACAIRGKWAAGGLPGVAVGVNLAEEQFQEADLVEKLEEAVRSANIEPADIHLEITETVLADGDSGAVEKLDELKARGFRLVLDDFGTGRSSLSRLCRFPIDAIKIDQHFIRNLGASEADEALVRAVLTLGADLGVEVVAEGIEEPDHLKRLQGLGCALGQGFLFSKAVAPEAAVKMLETSPFHKVVAGETAPTTGPTAAPTAGPAVQIH